MTRPRRLHRGIYTLLGLLAAGALSACASQSEPAPKPANPEPVIKLPPAPPYAEVARAYNQRIAGLTQMRGSAVVRIDYVNEKGDRERTQGEGLIQIVTPDRLALGIGKVSTTLFWLGSDDKRYWWFDLTGDTRVAFVGTHDRFDPELGQRLGIVAPPRDLIRLLSVLPLPEGPKAGRTDRSSDGAYVGVFLPLAAGGTQRFWLDPNDYFPKQVDLLDASGACTLRAKLERPVMVTTSTGGNLPRLPGRITIHHLASNALFILDLDDLTDGKDRISPKAFEFDELVKTFHPDKIVNLDERSRPPATPSTPPAPAPRP
ncbi:MAG: hypothetical protein ACREJO_13905 [Phycisphaerales bacterium]